MDGKKKKGKKKKGNQRNVSGSIFIADVNQTKLDGFLSNAEVPPDNDRDPAPALNHHSEAPSNADSQSVGISESDVDQEKRKNLEVKCGSLEERIKLLQTEVNSCIQKEARLEEKIDDLRSKNALLTGILEERIKFLQNEVDSCIQKEAIFEKKIDDLQSKNASMMMREVMELRDSRDNLAQENKQLTDNMSTLESRIQRLEVAASFYASSKIHGEEKSSPKAAEASTKPDMLNDKGSEKASEIHVEPVHFVGTADNLTSESTIKHSSAMKSSALESNKTIETEAKANGNLHANGVEDLGSMAQLRQMQGLGFDDSRISEDVVSVQLDDIIEELKPTADKMETEHVVPLSDAPLIGAPFRLISFVARFVSGSDLVDKDKPKEDPPEVF